ncbi:MAG: hypothetical protein HUJ98_01505 [Bacteroidaceae bacterium]|nr:hypothetical protein [Bacteroidaceae bacterium]
MNRIVFVFLSIMACVLQMNAQYQVTVVGSKDDTVTLRSVGQGKNAKKAAAAAELSAIDYVMYVGCSGTKYSMALIQDDKRHVEENNDFFDNFNDGVYRDFVESSSIVVPFGKNGLKQKSITLDVCVRVKQLREYLEKNNIIRKFGF